MLAAGGKRLRPRITLLAAEACGGRASEHLHLAAYMELIHVATLIHDDVVDNAQTRRGVNATAVDYGNRVSVLAGDYLFAWIFKNVTLNYPHPDPERALGDASRHLRRRGAAASSPGQSRSPVETYVEIARKKTASLFAASAAMRRNHGRRQPCRSRGTARVRRMVRHRVSDERRLARHDRRRTLARQTGRKRSHGTQDDHSADCRARIGQRQAFARKSGVFTRKAPTRRFQRSSTESNERAAWRRPARRSAASSSEPRVLWSRLRTSAAKKEMIKLTEALES